MHESELIAESSTLSQHAWKETNLVKVLKERGLEVSDINDDLVSTINSKRVSIPSRVVFIDYKGDVRSRRSVSLVRDSSLTNL